ARPEGERHRDEHPHRDLRHRHAPGDRDLAGRVAVAATRAHGCEAGRGDELTRRKDIGARAAAAVTKPLISSPLMVISPTTVPFVWLNVNTSPDTVPSIGPENVVLLAPCTCKAPVTFGPR